MKKGVCIVLISCCMLGGICIDTNAQTLKNYAKQRNQELAERQRMEKSNYEKACQKNTLAALNEYLSMYPKGKYVQDIRSRIADIERKNEQDLYDYAAKVETAQAYEAYLKKYPNGRFTIEAKGRLEDMELWKKAKSANTIAAYRHYMSTSKNKSFAQLANDAITDLESKAEWNTIKYSSSKYVIENFKQKYPKTSCMTEANRRICELVAVELYGQGDFQGAYDKFEAAGGRYSIESSNRYKYDECLEFVEYKKLSSYSTESDLLAFLKKYPSSKYYNHVSNLVAIAKAKNFSMFASSYNFNEAMSYAKDKTTKNTVQKYINSTKHSYNQYIRQQRHNRVMNNGGYVKYGIEIMDFGLAGMTSGDEGQKTLYYNVGLSVKFGNYKSPLQFEVGIKPGIVHTVPKYHDSYGYSYDSYGYSYDSYSYSNEDSKTFFHMPVFAKLKINICDAGRSKCYIAGIGTYNAVKEKNFENDYSVGGGIGFAWKKWDWFALYYKQDIENKIDIDDKYIGTSIVYYF